MAVEASRYSMKTSFLTSVLNNVAPRYLRECLTLRHFATRTSYKPHVVARVAMEVLSSLLKILFRLQLLDRKKGEF